MPALGLEVPKEDIDALFTSWDKGGCHGHAPPHASSDATRHERTRPHRHRPAIAPEHAPTVCVCWLRPPLRRRRRLSRLYGAIQDTPSAYQYHERECEGGLGCKQAGCEEIFAQPGCSQSGAGEQLLITRSISGYSRGILILVAMGKAPQGDGPVVPLWYRRTLAIVCKSGKLHDDGDHCRGGQVPWCIRTWYDPIMDHAGSVVGRKCRVRLD